MPKAKLTDREFMVEQLHAYLWLVGYPIGDIHLTRLRSRLEILSIDELSNLVGRLALGRALTFFVPACCYITLNPDVLNLAEYCHVQETAQLLQALASCRDDSIESNSIPLIRLAKDQTLAKIIASFQIKV